MNRIDELIQQLCPEGVTFLRLGEVSEMQRGSTITKKEIIEGNIPVIAGGQTPAYYCNKYNRNGETITVAGSGAYAGYVAYWNENIFVSDAFSIKGIEGISHTKYLYYVLKNLQERIYGTKQGAGIPHVHISNIDKWEIPIPPLSIQSIIVSIMDKFTRLEAELETELNCRKQQYEYYSNKLLSFENENNVEWKTLGSIGTVCMCKRIMKHQTSESGDVPFYKIGTFGKKADAYISKELYEDYKQRFSYPQKGDLLISAAGTIGRTVVFDGTPSYFQDSNIVWLRHNESIVLNSYLRHIYAIVEWKTDGGTIKRLYNESLLSTVIPVPPLKEQSRIANILDRFEALTTSISEGLPAEIAARKQQYEYYRNKLLTFNRKAV